MIMENSIKNLTFDSLVENAVKIPGVKVNRNEFLVKTFEGENVDIHKLIDDGPVAAGVAKSKLRELAEKQVQLRTSAASVASFVAGIPGGLAYAVTIPADLIQFFGISLRVTQEVSYIYGAENLWDSKGEGNSFVTEQLILNMGTMFNVKGAAEAVRFIATNNDYQIDDETFKAVTSSVSKELVCKLTEDTAAKGISKIIPIVGGLVSGGYTYITMQPMGVRLASVLEEAAFDYTDEKREKDFEVIECVATSTKKNEASADELFEGEAGAVSSEKETDAFEKIKKLAELKDAGVITEAEFMEKKKNLLDSI